VRNRNTQIDITNKTYEEIRQECLSKGILFEDPEFPADDLALFFSQRPRMRFEWKRPHVCLHLHTQSPAMHTINSNIFFISSLLISWHKLSHYIFMLQYFHLVVAFFYAELHCIFCKTHLFYIFVC